MDWKQYFQERPSQFEETDFLRQVGKTVLGQPITPLQLDAQVSDIQKALQVTRDDRVLDLCCGNGIITALMAQACRSVVGVDYSAPLIRIARKYNNPENVTYYCMSALDPELTTLPEQPFTKIYMYEALQHFDEEDLPELLARMRQISFANTRLFLGGIPDIQRIWNFYDTPERREEYLRRKRENREAIGTWWDSQGIADACARLGYDCVIEPQNALLHSAHYRFDVLLVPHVDAKA